MLNHAFLIIAHDSPELLKRIINNVKVPNHYVFIHLIRMPISNALI